MGARIHKQDLIYYNTLMKSDLIKEEKYQIQIMKRIDNLKNIC